MSYSAMREDNFFLVWGIDSEKTIVSTVCTIASLNNHIRLSFEQNLIFNWYTYIYKWW